MYGRRIPRKRGLSSPEKRTNSSVSSVSSQQQSNLIVQLLPNRGSFEIIGCKHQPHICGTEAACRSFPNNTSKCVCPHDLSPPTSDLKCPNRVIVPLTPRPIHNIIPPSNNNSTNTTNIIGGPEAKQVEGEPNERNIEILVGILGLCLFGAIVILIIICCIKRRSVKSSQRSSSDESSISLKKEISLAPKCMANPQYFEGSPSDLEILIIKRENLAFLRDIGEGFFGKVYKGEWRNGNRNEIVAIKVLKVTTTREAETDFIREVDAMSTFHHPNILSLKGIVYQNETNSPWMVFEYMPYGDLTEVLRANSPEFSSSRPGLQPLTKDQLCWISIQIASGMTYLSTQRFVHRDLACRNCLVGAGLTVKIADFGMSRDIYTCDYYKMGSRTFMPVRWMSPESVMYGKFTLESDVWSFGVVLWEIFSFGKQPYYGYGNEEVMKYVCEKSVLNPPEECPPIVEQIMRECWMFDSTKRIKFPEILKGLYKAQDKLTQQETLPKPPQGPITVRTPDALDPDGYLLPAPAIPHDYLQTLPSLSDD